MNFKEFDFETFAKTKRSCDFLIFAEKVKTHIEDYTIPQYGDKGEDPLTQFTAEDCVTQIKKYAIRFGKNARIGQEKLDLLKIAHYAQVAYDKLEEKENDSSR